MPRREWTREERLAYLIRQQEKDARRDRIRRQGPEPETHPDHAVTEGADTGTTRDDGGDSGTSW
jgi:hypothetical protein